MKMNSCTRKTVSHAAERTHTSRLPVERCNIVSSCRLLICHFRNEQETVLGLLPRNWPIADRRVYSGDPRNTCGPHFGSRGPFLESPVKVSGPKSNFQIEIERIRAPVLAGKLLHSVPLTDTFIMLDAKLLKPLPCM